MDKLRLFCIPYAGGTAAVFYKWKTLLDERIELIPIELSGKGSRSHEPLYSTIEEAVDDIYAKIKEQISNGSYVLFGHSLGALLAYALTVKIRDENVNMPEHLFFSGLGSPFVKRKNKNKTAGLNDKDFIRSVIKLGGTPAGFFDEPDLCKIFLPLLRNDFRLAMTDFAGQKPIPFNCNISILLGKNETISHKAAKAWEDCTNKLFKLHYFKGGHFFINEDLEELIKIINNDILVSNEEMNN